LLHSSRQEENEDDCSDVSLFVSPARFGGMATAGRSARQRGYLS
jgi:hypothetical protein